MLWHPERAQHAKVKHRVAVALDKGTSRAGCSCWMLPDGMTVRIDDETAHEPDALVYCGAEVSPDAVEVTNPVIVVEVLAPSTRDIDASARMMGYFSLPNLVHDLIIDPDKLPIVHHRKQTDGTILTRLMHQGDIHLDPPSISFDVADIV